MTAVIIYILSIKCCTFTILKENDSVPWLSSQPSGVDYNEPKKPREKKTFNHSQWQRRQQEMCTLMGQSFVFFLLWLQMKYQAAMHTSLKATIWQLWSCVKTCNIDRFKIGNLGMEMNHSWPPWEQLSGKPSAKIYYECLSPGVKNGKYI